MQLNLPGEMSAFVQNLVTQGRFDCEQEAVVEGIRLLISREQLRAEIQEGIRELDNGEWVGEETAFSDVDAIIDRAEAERQGK